MSNASQILDSFLNEKGCKFGGVILLAPRDAVAFIDLATTFGRKIHGADGIFELDRGRRPSLEDSRSTDAQFRLHYSARNIAALVKDFINERSHIADLKFEVVFYEA